jgi:hypothetical protein
LESIPSHSRLASSMRQAESIWVPKLGSIPSRSRLASSMRQAESISVPKLESIPSHSRLASSMRQAESIWVPKLGSIPSHSRRGSDWWHPRNRGSAEVVSRPIRLGVVVCCPGKGKRIGGSKALPQLADGGLPGQWHLDNQVAAEGRMMSREIDALGRLEARHGRERRAAALPNISSHADLVQHWRGPTSAPMRNRSNSSRSSFSSSFFFYLDMGYPSWPHRFAR